MINPLPRQNSHNRSYTRFPVGLRRVTFDPEHAVVCVSDLTRITRRPVLRFAPDPFACGRRFSICLPHSKQRLWTRDSTVVARTRSLGLFLVFLTHPGVAHT
jgi:hypothetical protein